MSTTSDTATSDQHFFLNIVHLVAHALCRALGHCTMETSSTAQQERDEDEPPPKKTKVEIPAEEEPNTLLGLVDHHVDPPALPADWVAVPHVSGATVYLHKPTRVVTLSRPYHVSTSTTIKKHSVYVQSIPCMEQWLFNNQRQSQLARDWHTRAQGKPGRLVKIVPEQLREYLSLCWDPQLLAEHRESRTESAAQSREEGRKEGKKTQQQQNKRQNPIIPEGLSKVVSVKIPVDYRKMVAHQEGKKPPAVWEVNLANKNSVVLLYEFCQTYLHTSPDFTFTQSKGPPYCCEVRVGGVRYGNGKGANKKIAKLSAASEALELFLPGAFSDQLTPAGSSIATSREEGLQLLSQVPIEDPQAQAILAQTGFPSPWQTLRNTLQWNQGFLSDKLTLDLQPLPETEDHTPRDTEVPPNHRFECVLRCGVEGGVEEGGVEGGGVTEVRVTCVGRKDGQVAAAQAMLKKLHPYITNWGSLLKLYSHSPPPSELPPPPPSSVAEGCGLLSGADQELLQSLRQRMAVLARERETSTDVIATSHLHHIHIRLSGDSAPHCSSS